MLLFKLCYGQLSELASLDEQACEIGEDRLGFALLPC